jgi:hypothetical protein
MPARLIVLSTLIALMLGARRADSYVVLAPGHEPLDSCQLFSTEPDMNDGPSPLATPGPWIVRLRQPHSMPPAAAGSDIAVVLQDELNRHVPSAECRVAHFATGALLLSCSSFRTVDNGHVELTALQLRQLLHELSELVDPYGLQAVCPLAPAKKHHVAITSRAALAMNIDSNASSTAVCEAASHPRTRFASSTASFRARSYVAHERRRGCNGVGRVA